MECNQLKSLTVNAKNGAFSTKFYQNQERSEMMEPWICEICAEEFKNEVDLLAHQFNNPCEKEIRIRREVAEYWGGKRMDYRKKLDEYYQHLGKEKPVHKMITNHLLCFADWLNESPQPKAEPEKE